MTKAKIQTAVIGLGRIGSQYDGGHSVALPRSHVGAILANPLFDLVAVFDSDAAARERFSRDWTVRPAIFDSIEALLAAQPYDVIVVAVPTALHKTVLKHCLAVRPALVFCEKPMCSSLTEAARQAEDFVATGIPLIVNYHRRWDERIAALRDALVAAAPIRAGHMLYVKGLYNYGAHAVDLLQNLFGPISRVTSRPVPSRGAENDPSVSAQLDFSNGLVVSLTGVDGLDFELFELDIVADRARFRLEAGGQSIRLQKPEDGRFFPGYVSLSEERLLVPDDAVHGLTAAYREIAAWVLERQAPTISTAENAVTVHRVLAAIEQSAALGAAVVP